MSARNSTWLWVLWLLACERTPDAPAFEAGPSWQSRTGVVAVDIAPNGQTLLLGEGLSESTLWYAPWKRSATLARVPGTLLIARFVADDRVLLASNQGGVGIYAADSGKELQHASLTLDQDSRRAQASDSGRYLAFDAWVYDLSKSSWAVRATRPAGQVAVGFSGERAAWTAGFHDASLTVLGLSGEPERSLRAPDNVSTAAGSRDGRYLAAGTTERVVIWRPDREAPSCEHGGRGRVTHVRFAASGEWLAFTAEDRLAIVRAADCSELGSLRLHRAATALDVDAELIAVGDADGYVYAWDEQRAALLAVSRSMPNAVIALRANAATRAVLAVSAQANGSTTKYLTLPAR